MMQSNAPPHFQKMIASNPLAVRGCPRSIWSHWPMALSTECWVFVQAQLIQNPEAMRQNLLMMTDPGECLHLLSVGDHSTGRVEGGAGTKILPRLTATTAAVASQRACRP
jgi:hypothetical protein